MGRARSRMKLDMLSWKCIPSFYKKRFHDFCAVHVWLNYMYMSNIIGKFLSLWRQYEAEGLECNEGLTATVPNWLTHHLDGIVIAEIQPEAQGTQAEVWVLGQQWEKLYDHVLKQHGFDKNMTSLVPLNIRACQLPYAQYPCGKGARNAM